MPLIDYTGKPESMPGYVAPTGSPTTNATVPTTSQIQTPTAAVTTSADSRAQNVQDNSVIDKAVTNLSNNQSTSTALTQHQKDINSGTTYSGGYDAQGNRVALTNSTSSGGDTGYSAP